MLHCPNQAKLSSSDGLCLLCDYVACTSEFIVACTAIQTYIIATQESSPLRTGNLCNRGFCFGFLFG